jgi:hypothetical protein
MTFRFDELSIHLMPAGDKQKDKDKEKENQGNRPGPRPDPNPELINNDDGGHGQGCTTATGRGTAKRTESRDLAQGLAFLRAHLRATLAPPPL